MEPARVVDPLTSALRGRRSTLSYAGMIVGFTKKLCTSLWASDVKSANGRDTPGQQTLAA